MTKIPIYKSLDIKNSDNDVCHATLKTRSSEAGVNIKRRQVNTMLVAALAAPHLTVSAQVTASTYSVTDLDWVDQVRSRPVPARLYWPSSASPEIPVPLVVFSHGLGGSRRGYSYFGKHLSSNGIASLHVQHVGSDAAVWRGNPFSLVNRLQDAAQEKEAIARAADVRFVLDRILSEKISKHSAAIDQQRLVAAGHSYGANTTLLTVGASVMRGDRLVDCWDSRFCAAVVVSAPPFYGESNLASVLSKISVPTIHVTSTKDVIEIPGYHSGVEDRLAIYNAIANPNKVLAVFNGGSHSMFTDRSITGGLSLNPKVKLATADLTLAFFDLIFQGNNIALSKWETSWKSILAQPLHSRLHPKV